MADIDEKLAEIEAENTRLRAALANSELPCAYCSLPKDEWNKCESGFPGCARGDDAMGCPELGASMRAEAAEAKLAAAEAEAARLRDALTPAFITCIAGDGDPYVKIQFKTLQTAHEFHGQLIARAALTPSSPNTEQEG